MNRPLQSFEGPPVPARVGEVFAEDVLQALVEAVALPHRINSECNTHNHGNDDLRFFHRRSLYFLVLDVSYLIRRKISSWAGQRQQEQNDLKN